MGSRAQGWAGRLWGSTRGRPCRLWWGSGRAGGLGWRGCHRGWGWGPSHASPTLQQAAVIVTEHQPSQGISGGAPRGPGPPLLAASLLPPPLPLLGALLPPPPLLLPLSLAFLGCHWLSRLRGFQGGTRAICSKVGQGEGKSLQLCPGQEPLFATHSLASHCLCKAPLNRLRRDLSRAALRAALVLSEMAPSLFGGAGSPVGGGGCRVRSMVSGEGPGHGGGAGGGDSMTQSPLGAQ